MTKGEIKKLLERAKNDIKEGKGEHAISHINFIIKHA